MLPISEKGYAFDAQREACVLSVYADSKNPAIGFGLNDPKLKPGDSISMDEAIAALLKEGARIQAFLAMTFAYANLLQSHVDALFSLAYNVGTGTIRDNVDLIKAIAASRTAPDDKHLRDVVGLEIIKTHPPDKPQPFNLGRRCQEAMLFTTGAYGDLSTLLFWDKGKNPHADAPQVVPMPKFLKA